MFDYEGSLFYNDEMVGCIASLNIETNTGVDFRHYSIHSSFLFTLRCEVHTFTCVPINTGAFDIKIFKEIRNDPAGGEFVLVSSDYVFFNLRLVGLDTFQPTEYVDKSNNVSHRVYQNKFEFNYCPNSDNEYDNHEIASTWRNLEEVKNSEGLEQFTFHRASFIRRSILRNENATPEIAAMLLLDKNVGVRKAAIKWMKKRKKENGE